MTGVTIPLFKSLAWCRVITLGMFLSYITGMETSLRWRMRFLDWHLQSKHISMTLLAFTTSMKVPDTRGRLSTRLILKMSLEYTFHPKLSWPGPRWWGSISRCPRYVERLNMGNAKCYKDSIDGSQCGLSKMITWMKSKWNSWGQHSYKVTPWMRI